MMVTRTTRLLRREKMEITVYTLIDLFAATKQTEGRSPRTVRWYKDTLTKFGAYLGNGSQATLRDCTLENARAFITSLQQRTTRYENHRLRPQAEGGLAATTVHGYVRALKSFSTWLSEEGFADQSPFARLKRPKVPEPLIEILSDQEIGAIFEAINPKCFLGSRLHVMALLLLDTGIRAAELCSLTIRNVSLDEQYIKVLGKGNKERIVPFGSTTKKALIRYLQTFRPEPANDRIHQLILSLDGAPLSYTGLYKAIQRLGKTAGVPRLHPHLFRHTFSVRYLMNGGDIMTLRLILGHTTLDVTQMYMHLAETHVKIQHDRFSPVDRLQMIGKRKR